MSLAPSAAARPVLADLLPGALVRDVTLVLGGALLTAAAAQITIPLGFTPVPITGQTFAVLLVAAALGPLRGVLSQGAYVGLGAVGLPFYTDGGSGVQHIVGATGGYLLGFIVAAAAVGLLARRGFDRKPHGMVAAYVAGSLVIYAFGAPWLALVAGMSFAEALFAGVVPFLLGDAAKAAAAGALLPVVWKLLGDR